MRIPTIHLNGTGKKALLEELEAAYRLLDAAIDAVARITVHGRDYYPQGDGAYQQARAEHDARKAVLTGVLDELMAIHVGIQQQGK